MKNRFTTLDLIAILPEIRQKLLGMRINQIYDVDPKTFIFRFSKPTQHGKVEEEESLKQMLILESGIRLHLTEFNWPKNSNPSGFTMKLRKHLRNKRLESITQVGMDRIVDMQFGSNDFASHVILELFSKGNIILTDQNYIILSLIRIYKDAKTNVNITVREKYPLNKDQYVAAQQSLLNRSRIEQIIMRSKEANFKKLFNPEFPYGPALLEHSLLQFKEVCANKWKVTKADLDLLEQVFAFAEKQIDTFNSDCSKGYIILKSEQRPNSEELFNTYDEFHPFLFAQFKSENMLIEECDSFNQAVDRFFSKMESQKIESKAMQQEKQALKKLEAIKKDHESRLDNLAKMQEIDNHKAQLIESNIELVDKAISVLRSAIANKYSWEMITEMVCDARDTGDLIASKIKDLKLDKNAFVMQLEDPYEMDTTKQPMLVEIDIDLTAFANARKYYEHRKDAAKKEQKTIDHSEKAFKNVERKVKQQLKENTIKTNIVLARKVLWFEKFFWFISSEGYLVIAGRDAQQNEMIVKRYLTKDDIYVHADIHGATSVVIKNHLGQEIPPKTLNEAANMAICYSASWDAKVVCAAYWVYSHQVQKTAPSGQYLSVGSFMIRGKKNYIPLQNLILGFGFLFRIDEESIEKRQEETKDESVNQTVNDTEVETREESSDNIFPDTSIRLHSNDQTAKEVSSSTPVLELDYTIVNTGEIVKKAKIITQKTLQKKTNQQTKNAKKEKRKAKKGQTNKTDQSTSVDNNDDSHQTNEVSKNDDLQDQQNQEVTQQQPSPDDQLETMSSADQDAEPTTEISAAVQENDADEEEEEDLEEENDAMGDSRNKSLEAKKILDSLIASPKPEDQLLYAIPVCGPYSAMHAYKYKVKIIPGTTKRGKASKTALMIFLKEKTATEREKDLLKAVKDLDIAKNMPGKVKIVASHLNSKLR